MRCSTLVAGLLSLAGAVSCLSTSHNEDVEVMESLRGVPEGWEAASTPNPNSRMHFRIALTKVRFTTCHICSSSQVTFVQAH
jgi:tripeptidyl-peptidase-1